MELRILGPLEVDTDGKQLVLGPTKQRALLAVLVVHANSVLTRDQLIDALWGEHPPDTAANALHGYVSGLRKVLGADRIATRSAGYLLRAEPGEVDLERFERLLGDARSLEPRAAADGLREALALWRGRPLADLDGAPFLEAERRRLDEIRLGAIEDRVEADLALGRQAQLIAELGTLVREHPLRERLRGQLMLSLYRSGRQAEALEVYRQGRNLLADELGLEPGEELKRLERGILEHDPALGPVASPEVPAALPTAPGAGRAGLTRLPRSRVAMVVAGALVLAVTVSVIAVALTSGSSGLAVRTNSVAVIDPKTNQLVDDVSVGTRPVAIAVGEGGVWVANEVDRTVDRIDPKTRQVEDPPIGIGTDVHDVAVGFGSVWVADGTDGTVTRIDAKTDHIVERLSLGAGASPPPVFWIAVGAGAVWATSGDSLLRIDPGSDKVVSRTRLFEQPTGLAVGGAVWVTTEDEQLLKFSVSDPSVASSSSDLRAAALAPTIGARSVWVIVYSNRGVIQPFDASSVSLGPGTETTSFPLDLAVGTGSVWAVDVRGAVLRINPATASIVVRIPTAPTIRSAIAVGAGAVWVAVQGT